MYKVLNERKSKIDILHTVKIFKKYECKNWKDINHLTGIGFLSAKCL